MGDVGAIVDADLQRAPQDPDPLHGIAQLVARWGAFLWTRFESIQRVRSLGATLGVAGNDGPGQAGPGREQRGRHHPGPAPEQGRGR